MSDSGKAVFLSYASQDAEAAKRICEALRAAGIEVWFDQSELRGGDAWDQKIRRQIKECALFVPVISANTNARPEGYFRLEWKLAVDRSHLMADDQPFLFPIVIGDVSDAAARVPDKFRDVQWTRLRLDETPAELAARVAKLLSSEQEPSFAKASEGRTRRGRYPAWLRYAGMIAGLAIGVIYAVRPLLAPPRRSEPKPTVVAPATPAISEARQLAERARDMSLQKYSSTSADFSTAEGLIQKALEMDPNDAEIWAISSLFHTSIRTRGFDHSSGRRQQARAAAEHAIKLAPDSVNALYALGRTQRDSDRAAAEATFKRILELEPDHAEAMAQLAWIYDGEGRPDDAAALYDRALVLDPKNAPLTHYVRYLLYFHYGRFAEADAAIKQSVTLAPSANSITGEAMVALTWHGDAEEAAKSLAAAPVALRSEPRMIWIGALVQLARRDPAETLRTLQHTEADYIQDNWFSGPKGMFAGLAHRMAGRQEAARVAWEAALALVDTRLKTTPDSGNLHLARGQLLAWLGRPDEARREARTLAEIQSPGENYWMNSPAMIYAALGDADAALPLAESFLKWDRNTNTGWPLTPALLRIDPRWDPIRSDPRFQKLCAEPAPRKTEDRGQKTAVSLPVDEKSVAVLAFANLSDDKANEYFSDGISEELLNVLAKVPGLKVTARTSSFHFKGKDTPIPEIAQQLGVAYVVEGSVRKSGDKVRITAQLIKAADGFHVWSDTFTRDLKDIFAVQDEIAGLIAKNLELKMGMATAEVRQAVDPEAYQLYLQGRQALQHRNREGYAQAEKFFQQAEKIAPKWAPIYAGLADVARLRSFGSGIGSPTGPTATWSQGMKDARIAAEQALALDPNLAEADVSLGGTYMLGWNFDEAERLVNRALELNPNLADAYLVLGRVHSAQGRMDEAIAAFQRASELNPLAPRILDNLAAQLDLAGRYKEGWAVIERATALQPDSSQIQCYRARLLTHLGRRDEALRQAQQLIDDPREEERDFRLLEAVGVLAAFGEREKAAAIAAKIPRDVPIAAFVLSYQGRPADALPLLGQINFGWIDDLLWGRTMDPIRRDPVYQQYLARTNLTAANARAMAWRAAHPVTEGPVK